MILSKVTTITINMDEMIVDNNVPIQRVSY